MTVVFVWQLEFTRSIQRKWCKFRHLPMSAQKFEWVDCMQYKYVSLTWVREETWASVLWILRMRCIEACLHLSYIWIPEVSNREILHISDFKWLDFAGYIKTDAKRVNKIKNYCCVSLILWCLLCLFCNTPQLILVHEYCCFFFIFIQIAGRGGGCGEAVSSKSVLEEFVQGAKCKLQPDDSVL